MSEITRRSAIGLGIAATVVPGMTFGQAVSAPDGSSQPTPHAKVATLGHTGHGKTTLTSVLTKLFGEFVPYEELANVPENRLRGITMSSVYVEYRTEERRYTHVDSGDHLGHMKGMITGYTQMDGAILVVSAVEGAMAETREHIRLARRVGVRSIVVLLNKIDLVEDETVLDSVETELRDLLSSHGFPGEDVPVVRGSARAALEGRNPEVGEHAIRALVRAIDELVPTPVRPIDQPFLMPVADVFSIAGRGTVATGRVERGTITVGQDVEIVGLLPTTRATCIGVEMFRKLLDRGEPGDNLGALLKGVDRDGVQRGQVLCEPGSMGAHTRFEAEAYILTKEEGGRHTPFFSNYRPQFYLRTADVTGTVELPPGTEMVMPGATVSLAVTLVEPIAMEETFRFAIREGGRTIGAGVVVRIG